MRRTIRCRRRPTSRHRRRHHRQLGRVFPRAGRRRRSRCSRRAASPASSPGRNWGWVRQQCRSPVELPLMMESLAIWKELPARPRRGPRLPPGRHAVPRRERGRSSPGLRSGSTSRARTASTRAVIAGRELTDAFTAGGRCAGALYTASDGRAEPSRAGRAIARAARRARARASSAAPRCAASRPRRGASPASSPSTAASRRAPSSAPPAPGRACSAARSGSACRSCRCSTPSRGSRRRRSCSTGRPGRRRSRSAGAPTAATRSRTGTRRCTRLVPASFREALKFLPALPREP